MCFLEVLQAGAGLCAGSRAGAAKPRHCLVNGPTTESPCRARCEPLYEDFELFLITNWTGRVETKPPRPCLAARSPGIPAQHPPRGALMAKCNGDEWQAEAARLGSASHPFQIQVSRGLFEQRPQPISSPQALCTCDSLQLGAALKFASRRAASVTAFAEASFYLHKLQTCALKY